MLEVAFQGRGRHEPVCTCPPPTIAHSERKVPRSLQARDTSNHGSDSSDVSWTPTLPPAMTRPVVECPVVECPAQGFSGPGAFGAGASLGRHREITPREGKGELVAENLVLKLEVADGDAQKTHGR